MVEDAKTNYNQRRSNEMSSFNSLDGLARSTLSLDTSEARNIRETRLRNRKEMHSLNEKLAAQLEKMRHLSAQNKQLLEEANKPKRSITREMEKLRQTYNNELKQLRQLVDDCEHERANSLSESATLQQKLRTKQYNLDQMTDKNENLATQLDQALKEISGKEIELDKLKRNFREIEKEREKLLSSLDQSQQANEQLNKNLEDESTNRMVSQSQMQTLREEMEFICRVHKQELEECKQIVKVEQQPLNTEWQNETKNAIRDIKAEYDRRLDKLSDDLESNYAAKLADLNRQSDVQNERFKKLTEDNNHLRSLLENCQVKLKEREQLERNLVEVNDINRDIRQKYEKLRKTADEEAQLAEEAIDRLKEQLASLLDAKLNLEAEIAAYRRLLEVQDTLIDNNEASVRSKNQPQARTESTSKYHTKGANIHVQQSTRSVPFTEEVGSVMAKLLDREEPSGHSSQSHHLEHNFEVSRRSNNSPNAFYLRGDLSLNHCSANGRFIEIFNKGNSVKSLAGWCLVRNIDHGRKIIRYTFPVHEIYPHTTLRIWAGPTSPTEMDVADLEAPHPNWGTGTNVQTSLYSPDGVERSKLVQDTTT